MGYGMLSYRKKLNQLTEFNQAIVYCVDPEAVKDPSNGLRVIAQHGDTLDAYLYLQDLLPTLKANLAEQLTPDYLLNLISGIHARIAKSLLAYTEGSVITAGQYTPYPVMRWQAGVELRDLIVIYFSVNYSLEGVKIKANMMVLMAEHVKKQGVSTDAVGALLSVLRTIEMNPLQYPVPANQERWFNETATDKRGLPGGVLLLRLAYNIHQFTAEQVREMRPVLLIPIIPEKINTAMQAFAERTCNAWKCIDPSDPAAVKKMVATVFYELTSIHPYSNGNGRTATALINLILKTLNYPSILMRLPGDKADSDSSYTKAMMQMEESRLDLIDHLGICLARADFSDETRKNLSCLRFKGMQDIDSINKKYPDLSGYVGGLINHIADIYLKGYPAAKELDVTRFIENILHFFATDKDKPLNNPKYQPGLFTNKAIEAEQEIFKRLVIEKLQSQFPQYVNQHKPS